MPTDHSIRNGSSSDFLELIRLWGSEQPADNPYIVAFLGVSSKTDDAIVRASETWRVVPRPIEARCERFWGFVQHLKVKLQKQVVATNLTFLAGVSVA
jgi:hypothetical protein